MNGARTSGTALPEEWAQVLEKVQEALAETAARASERAHAADLLQDAPAARLTIAYEAHEEASKGLHELAIRAAREAEATDAALRGAEAALREWLEAAATVRRKLAARPPGHL
jgi:hypothetical protein